jgi:hypothetical protein
MRRKQFRQEHDYENHHDHHDAVGLDVHFSGNGFAFTRRYDGDCGPGGAVTATDPVTAADSVTATDPVATTDPGDTSALRPASAFRR